MCVLISSCAYLELEARCTNAHLASCSELYTLKKEELSMTYSFVFAFTFVPKSKQSLSRAVLIITISEYECAVVSHVGACTSHRVHR